MVPSHPFKLVVLHKDGRRQEQSFQTIATATAAADRLRPALVKHYELCMILDVASYHEHRTSNGHRFVEVVKAHE